MAQLYLGGVFTVYYVDVGSVWLLWTCFVSVSKVNLDTDVCLSRDCLFVSSEKPLETKG